MYQIDSVFIVLIQNLHLIILHNAFITFKH